MNFRPFFKQNHKKPDSSNSREDFSIELFTTLNKNTENLKKMLDEPNDLTIREFSIGTSNYKCAVVYIDGLVDKDLIHDKIMKNIQIEAINKKLPESEMALLDVIYSEIISVSDVTKGKTLDDVSLAILSGDTILFLEGVDQALLIGTKGWESRSIEEPTTESLIRKIDEITELTAQNIYKQYKLQIKLIEQLLELYEKKKDNETVF